MNLFSHQYMTNNFFNYSHIFFCSWLISSIFFILFFIYNKYKISQELWRKILTNFLIDASQLPFIKKKIYIAFRFNFINNFYYLKSIFNVLNSYVIPIKVHIIHNINILWRVRKNIFYSFILINKNYIIENFILLNEMTLI